MNALSLNDNGSKIRAIGIRGANRTFYYTNAETTVPVLEIKNEYTFFITPNPVQAYQSITVHLPESWNSGTNRSITIYQINGMLIRKDVNIPQGLVHPIPGLPKGMYAILFKSNTTIATNKLIVL